MEEWRTIIEFQSYEVSSEGRIRNISTGRVLKQQKHPRTGIWMVPLQKHRRQYTRSIHRLMAEAFLYPPEPNMVPVHLDNNRDNNTLDNIDWKTLSQAREITDTRTRDRPKDPRPVRAVEDDVIFENALAAAQAINGLERQVLIAAMSDGTMTYKRNHWEFMH